MQPHQQELLPESRQIYKQLRVICLACIVRGPQLPPQEAHWVYYPASFGCLFDVCHITFPSEFVSDECSDYVSFLEPVFYLWPEMLVIFVQHYYALSLSTGSEFRYM